MWDSSSRFKGGAMTAISLLRFFSSEQSCCRNISIKNFKIFLHSNDGKQACDVSYIDIGLHFMQKRNGNYYEKGCLLHVVCCQLPGNK
jgi:hypothetical protein